jgi:hypothetical protein
MSERNKITDLGENINNPLHLHPRILGRDAPRPTLLKRRGGKSQEEAGNEHVATLSIRSCQIKMLPTAIENTTLIAYI